MSSRTARIVRISIVAALVVAGTGVVGLVSIGLSLALGEPWTTVRDVARVLMIGALAPLMLSFYELGGWTPLRLAQLAQTLGWVAVFTFVGVQVILLTFGAGLDIDASNSGAFLAGAVALGYIGLWIGGANVLAGPWLTSPRPVGVLAGLATVFFGVGLVVGGLNSPFTTAGAVGCFTVVPLWGFLMARLLRGIARQR